MSVVTHFNPKTLRKHFRKHRKQFLAKTAHDYETLAITFMGSLLNNDTLECIRPSGTVVRFNVVSDEFGVVLQSGMILTYYKADPKEHHQPTNLDYFYQECKKQKP